MQIDLKSDEIHFELVRNLRDTILSLPKKTISTVVEAVKISDHFTRAKILHNHFKNCEGPTIGGT